MKHLNRVSVWSRAFAILTVATLGVSSWAQPLVPLSPAERASRTATLEHTPWDGKSANKGVSQQDGCTMRTENVQVTDPVTKMTRSYDLLVQIPQSSAPVPVVIIVPTIMGTSQYVEPVVAHQLCFAGYGSVIADVNDVSDPVQFPAWGGEDENSRKAILALKTVVDFAQTIPQFDRNRVGALGISLGGITTALWTGVDPRLKASVIIVGGGNMPYILAHSDEGHVAHLREKRMQAAGLQTVDDYDAKLRSTVMLDPFYFAPQADHHRILMVMAETDTKVPYVVQQEQFEAFGKPESLTFAGGHEVTIGLMVYLYMDDVTTFLDAKLKTPTPFALQNSSTDVQPIKHKIVDLDRLGY